LPRLLQVLAEEKQTAGVPLLLPHCRHFLHRFEILLQPLAIAILHRLDQPVVRQFKPCGPGALFAANEMRIFQARNQAVI